MLKNYAIVTVRNSSTRLPNKAILPVAANLLSIEVVIARARHTGFPVVIATSTDATDDVFEEIALKNGVQIFRGALLNKLQRWKDCFDALGIDQALLVDGDDLMYDFNTGRRAIDVLTASDALMIKHPENVICGYFTYAIKKAGIEALASFAENAQTNTDVITEFVTKSGIGVEILSLLDWEKDKPYRLTLDYSDDLDFFKALIAGVGIDADGKTVTAFLDAHPEIVNINLHRQADCAKNQAAFNEKVRTGIQ